MNTEQLKNVADVASVSTIIGTIVGWLPHIAALFAVVWGAFRMYEGWLDVQIKRLELEQARRDLERDL